MNTLRLRLAAFVIAAAVFVLAAAFAFLTRSSNPYGIWLYTPSNWCTGLRTNSFALVYGAVTISSSLFLGLLAVALAIASRIWKVSTAAPTLRTMASVAIWSAFFVVLAALLTPLTEVLLPNAADPNCATNAP